MDNKKKILMTGGGVIAVIGIIAVIKLAPFNFGNKKVSSLLDTSMFSKEVYMQMLATENSDIDGWSKLDKYNAGLNPSDGSDTDGDGLTDKEEIEVYHSDPLKSSTADDLYTDGYKIANGMDVNTHYDYGESVEFKNNQCSEVIFTATKQTDLNAAAEPWVIQNVKGYDVYANYHIYNYGGKLSINVTDILNERSANIKDISVLKCDWHGDNMQKVDATADGNILTLKDDIASDDDFVVIIAKKNKGITFGAASSTNIAEANNTADGGVFMFFSLSALWGQGPKIQYVPCGNTEVDEANKEALVREAIALVDADMPTSKVKITTDDVEVVSQSEFDSTLSLYKKMLWAKKTRAGKFALSLYCTLDMVSGINERGASNTAFKASVDALPFTNFRSAYSPGGNCAGFAHFTSLLFNTGSAPSSGSYSGEHTDYKTISWDISGDEANATLINPGLNDYKDDTFTDKHENKNTLIMENLSPGEDEFVKMIAAYWAEANDYLHANNYIMTQGKSNYNWNLIEGIMKYLDQGKILDAAFLVSEDVGHVINITGYKINDTNPNLIEFTVYDNSCTGSLIADEYNPHLYVTRKKSSYSNEDTFEFYCKTSKQSKVISSQLESTDKYCMIVYDDKWNILNDIYEGNSN